MATFVWDPAVQWPPPAHILSNYDVVAPGGAVLSLHRASEMEERMTQPFLALITPLGSGGQPDQGLPGQPPGFWGGVAPPYPDQGLPGGQPHPSHPIAPGGRPPGIWGGAPPYPDQGLPGQPPGIWPSPGYPAHPIAPGGQPPGIWPSPGYPSHPIVLPPYEPGGPPVTIWPNPGQPTHPIVIPQPPENPPEGNKPPPEGGGWAYAADYGWGYFPGVSAPGPK
jgi:hypothetical protein